MRSQEHLDALERMTRLPMLVLALLMIPVLVGPEVVPLSSEDRSLLDAADATIWALFALEYGAKVLVAPRRGRYVRDHWLDLLLVALPILRPLRLVRSARAIFALRLVRVAIAWADSLVILRRAVHRHGLGYLVLSGALLVAVGAVLITVIERDAPNATIHSLWDGLWWATATISTVGYGDAYPVTAPGKALAVVLMLIGIGFFSAITAVVAATIVESGQDRHGEQLDQVLERLAHLEAMLAGRTSDAEHDSPRT